MNCVDMTEATSVSCEPISTRFHSRMSCMRLYIGRTANTKSAVDDFVK